MNLEDQNLDNLFKDTLEDKSAPFDPAAWEKAAPLLRKRKSKKIGFWLGGASLLILLLLFSFQSYLFNDKANNNSNTTVKTEVKLTSKKQIKKSEKAADLNNNNNNNNNNTAQESRNETNTLNNENTPSLRTVTTHNTGVNGGKETMPAVVYDMQTKESASDKIGNQLNPPNPSIKENKNEKFNSKADKNLASAILNNTDTPEKDEQILSSLVPNNLNNPSSRSSIDKNKKSSQLFKLTKRSNPLTFSFLKRTPTLLSSFLKDSFNKAKYASIAKIDLLVDPDFKKSINWSVGFYAGTGHIINNNLNELTEKAYTLNLTGVRSQLAGINLKAEYGRLGLTLGLEHQKYLFQETLEQRQENITIDTVYRVITKNKIIGGERYWVIDESFDTSTSTSTKQHLNKEETSVSYLQVPFEFSYRLQVLRKVSIMPSVGARINIPIGISGFRISNNNLETATVNSVNTNVNLFAGLSVAYQVHPRWLVGFQNRYIHQEKLSNTLNQGLNKGSIVNALTFNYLIL